MGSETGFVGGLDAIDFLVSDECIEIFYKGVVVKRLVYSADSGQGQISVYDESHFLDPLKHLEHYQASDIRIRRIDPTVLAVDSAAWDNSL